jgi:hypothetical protein
MDSSSEKGDAKHHENYDAAKPPKRRLTDGCPRLHPGNLTRKLSIRPKKTEQKILCSVVSLSLVDSVVG